MLGLLAEAECRAAEMLLAHGVDTAAVRKRWPALRLGARVRKRDFSPAVVAALEAAVDRLWEYPRPLVLATEHILLGLVAAPGETAAWLAEHGFDPDRLEVQIHRLYGHDPGPLPLDASQSAQTAEDVVAADVAANAPNAARTHPGHLPEGEGTGFATRRSIKARHCASSTQRRIAREGLRVVEDYVRLVLDDRHLTRELKELRHDLQAVLRFAGQDDLLACRDTLSDVGTSVSTAAESERADLASVVAANWKRLQEALRSLEEYAKIAHPTAAAEIERLRYRSYTLERAVEITGTSCERLAVARVCVLVDGRETSADFERLVDAVIAGGAPMIQLRDKTLPDRDLLRRAELLRAGRALRACCASSTIAPTLLPPYTPTAFTSARTIYPSSKHDRSSARAGSSAFQRTRSSKRDKRSSMARTTSGSDRPFPQRLKDSMNSPASSCCGRWLPKSACRLSPSAA